MKFQKESSGIWIFQANRKYYRFFDLIRAGDFDKEWWHADRFKNYIKKGNIMLFWLTEERPGSKDAGIYAIGEVIIDPKIITLDDCVIDYCTPEYKERFPDGNLSYPHFRCRLTKEFIDKPILKECLLDNAILKDMSIITTRGRGTNFRVTEEQWDELKMQSSL